MDCQSSGDFSDAPCFRYRVAVRPPACCGSPPAGGEFCCSKTALLFRMKTGYSPQRSPRAQRIRLLPGFRGHSGGESGEWSIRERRTGCGAGASGWQYAFGHELGIHFLGEWNGQGREPLANDFHLIFLQVLFQRFAGEGGFLFGLLFDGFLAPAPGFFPGLASGGIAGASALYVALRFRLRDGLDGAGLKTEYGEFFAFFQYGAFFIVIGRDEFDAFFHVADFEIEAVFGLYVDDADLYGAVVVLDECAEFELAGEGVAGGEDAGRGGGFGRGRRWIAEGFAVENNLVVIKGHIGSCGYGDQRGAEKRSCDINKPVHITWLQ